MEETVKNILSTLQKQVLPYEGYRRLATDNQVDIGFRPIEQCFPNRSFPLAAIHDFTYASAFDAAATTAFITVLLGRLTSLGGSCIWLSRSAHIFPAALKTFGLQPEHCIFISLEKEKELLWTFDEALKCDKITAVVGEISNITFKESRKLQLSVEQSRATGFLLRDQRFASGQLATIAKWQVSSLPSLDTGMPGVGFPAWHVALQKVRNGIAGSWDIAWVADHFMSLQQSSLSVVHREQKRAV